MANGVCLHGALSPLKVEALREHRKGSNARAELSQDDVHLSHVAGISTGLDSHRGYAVGAPFVASRFQLQVGASLPPCPVAGAKDAHWLGIVPRRLEPKENQLVWGEDRAFKEPCVR